MAYYRITRLKDAVIVKEHVSTIGAVAEFVQLDEAEIEWAFEEFGTCTTDEYFIEKFN